MLSEQIAASHYKDGKWFQCHTWWFNCSSMISQKRLLPAAIGKPSPFQDVSSEVVARKRNGEWSSLLEQLYCWIDDDWWLLFPEKETNNWNWATMIQVVSRPTSLQENRKRITQNRTFITGSSKKNSSEQQIPYIFKIQILVGSCLCEYLWDTRVFSTFCLMWCGW